MGEKHTDGLIEAMAQTAFQRTRATDNTDHEAGWRKKRVAPDQTCSTPPPVERVRSTVA